MKIGVLAVQGAFIEHRKMLESLGAECVEIRQPTWKAFRGIVLPGGESTVQGKLLHKLDMFEEIQTRIRKDFRCWHCCAGMILLAQPDPLQRFGDPSCRFRYGSAKRIRKTAGQLHHESAGQGHRRIPDGVHSGAVYRIRGRFQCRSSVHRGRSYRCRTVRQPLSMSFHPEMTDDTRIHRYFLKMIQ